MDRWTDGQMDMCSGRSRDSAEMLREREEVETWKGSERTPSGIEEMSLIWTASLRRQANLISK